MTTWGMRNNFQRQGRRAMKAIGNLSDIDSDDVLEAIGLQRRTSVMSEIWSAVGFFAAGALVGAGVGLFFAPKPGELLREDVVRRFERTKAQVRESAERMSEHAPTM